MNHAKDICIVLRGELLYKYKSYVVQLRDFHTGKRSLLQHWRDMDHAYTRYAYYLAKDSLWEKSRHLPSVSPSMQDEKKLKAKLKWLVENTRFGEK